MNPDSRVKNGNCGENAAENRVDLTREGGAVAVVGPLDQRSDVAHRMGSLDLAPNMVAAARPRVWRSRNRWPYMP